MKIFSTFSKSTAESSDEEEEEEEGLPVVSSKSKVALISSVTGDDREENPLAEGAGGVTRHPARASRIRKIVNSIKGINEFIRNMHNKPYERIDYGEKVVYRRLMDDLEEEEEGEDNFRFPAAGWSSLKKAGVIFEIIVLLGLVGLLASTLTVPAIKHVRFLKLRIWQYVMLSIALLSGLSIIRFITLLISIPILWWWRIDRYMVFFVRKIKRCVDVTLWFGSVLFIWYVWFRPRLKHVHGDLSAILVKQVTILLIALDLGAFLWFIKDIINFKLEADLHYIQLFDRIRNAVLYYHGLQMIENSGNWKFLITKNERKDEIRKKNNNNNKISKKRYLCRRTSQQQDDIEEKRSFWIDISKMKKDTVPIWILRGLANKYLYHMQQQQEKKKKIWGNPEDFKDDKKLMSLADKMREKVIMVVQEYDPNSQNRKYIIDEDLDKYNLSKKERDMLFSMFEKSASNEGGELEADPEGRKVISRNQFLNWAVRAFNSCSGLERTLYTSKEVFLKLNRLMSAFVVIVDLIIWLLLTPFVNSGQIALLFTPFLAASFIFGDSCKKMFEGLIFAFAAHPFHVGDRVIIEEKQMKVNELNILTSVFFKYDSGELVIYPNSQLATLKIINLDITPDQGDCLEFTVDCGPLEDIQDLQICIKKYLDDDPEYTSNNKVVKKEISNGEIKMAVHFKYLVSYLSMETKDVHKSQILTKIMEFQNEMKLNQRRNSSSAAKPVIVHFDIPATTTLKQINKIKRAIIQSFEYVGKDFKQCSKVVMTELIGNKEIKMALYLRKKKTTVITPAKGASNIVGSSVIKVEDHLQDLDEEVDVDTTETIAGKGTDHIEAELRKFVQTIIREDQEGLSATSSIPRWQ